MRVATAGIFFAMLFGSGVREAPSQEVPPMLLVYTPDVSHGGFTGEVSVDGESWHLKPNDYAAGFLPFDAQGTVSAIASGPQAESAKFSLEHLSYGQQRYIRVAIVAGRVVIEEIHPGGVTCVPRGLHNAGTSGDRDVNNIYFSAECVK